MPDHRVAHTVGHGRTREDHVDTCTVPIEGRTLPVRLQRRAQVIMGDVISVRHETMPDTFRSSKISISVCLACSCPTKLAGFHVTMTNADDLLFQRQEDPKSDKSLGQGFVALVVLKTNEAAMHDDFTPIDTHCWGLYPAYWYTKPRQLLEFITCKPIGVRVHHVRIHKAQAENARTLNQTPAHVCLRGA